MEVKRDKGPGPPDQMPRCILASQTPFRPSEQERRFIPGLPPIPRPVVEPLPRLHMGLASRLSFEISSVN